jgi:hypothetical protein
MAEIVAETQGPEAAQDYRRRVFALEPYSQFAGKDLSATENVEAAAVSLDRLDYAGSEHDTGSVPGIALEPMVEPADASGSQPSWMRAQADSPDEASSLDKSVEDNPAFVRQAGWKPADSSAFDAAAAEHEPAPAAVPGELPAWVQALAPTEESDTTSPEKLDWPSPDGGPAPAPMPAPTTATMEDHQREGETGDSLQALVEESGIEEGPGLTPVQASEQAQESQSNDPGVVGTGAEEQEDGLAWLEALADEHGAKPEGKSPASEPPPDEVPAWVSGEQGPGESTAKASAMALSGDEAAGGSTELVDKDDEPPVGDATLRGSTEEPGPPGEAKPYDWLEGLTDRDAPAATEAGDDGAEAPTIADDGAAAWPQQAPRPAVGEEPPWLGSDRLPTTASQSEPAAEAPGEYESSADLPAWLADLDKPESDAVGSSAAAQPEPTAVAKPTDWQPAGSDDLLASGASTGGETPEGVGMSASPGSFDAAGGPQPEAADQPGAPLPSKTRPGVPQRRLATPSLEGAQAEMARGNIAAALEHYGKLIRKGKSLEGIIRQLRDALYRYPVEVPIWQSLGDAYMRANRLQEALDAYTKAEELLR